MRKYKHDSAFVMVMAMVLMSLMVAMAVSFASVSNMNVQAADSIRNSDKALMAAESGLSHVIMLLSGTPVATSTPAGIMNAAANKLSTDLDGTANLLQESIVISYDGNGDAESIVIPSINLSPDQSYTVSLEWVSGSLLVLSTGQFNDVSRQVSMEMNAEASSTGGEETEPGKSFFDYGIASKSPIRMTGNASITGVNNPAEADMLSATYSTDQAFKLTGNCDIDGDLSTCNPDSYVTTAGNVSVGGATGSDIDDHVHIGIGDVDFPEVDPSVFEPYATNIVDSSTRVTGNRTFENIRIAAGTNPTFGGNITVNGVVFIETPNRVKFTGNLNFTGVIVTEDAGDNNFADNYLQFTGNMTSAGVESLPSDSQFDGLRETPGSMLLAPGFEVKFTGNFNTMNGAIAADKFKFTGNAGGQVDGPVICYGDTEFFLTGNSNLQINRSNYSSDPPGFTPGSSSGSSGSTSQGSTLTPDRESYEQ